MMFSQYLVSTRRILSLTTILLVICCIVIIFTPTPAHTHPMPNSDAANKRYCSTALFEAIQVICNGRYNTLSDQFPDSIGNNHGNPLRRLLPETEFVFRPSLSGAVHECCRRPCGYSELRGYCAD